MTERIVIGIDEGVASDAAVEWVVARAGSRPVRIDLVTAVDELMVDRGQDERLESARAHILDRLRTVSVELVSAEGPLEHVILEHAARGDLLVLGNHRTRALRSAISGSTALRLAAVSPIPTVVVPDDFSSGDGSIVLGVAADGSSDGAVAFAAAEASRAGTVLDVVHAWGVPAATETLGFPDRTAEIVADHRALLDAVGRRLRSKWPDLTVCEYLVGDDEADALVGHAADSRLIVLGTHGGDPISGILRGSVVEAVTRRSREPVCIVPAGWRPTPTISA